MERQRVRRSGLPGSPPGLRCHEVDRDAEANAAYDGRRAREAPGSLSQAALGRLQRHAGNHAVQRALAREVAIQPLRDYAAVPFTKMVGPGKMLKKPSDTFHYTITKAASPASAYTDQFHVTFERGAPAGHPHFYFTDLGSYISSFEGTQQNQNFINRKGGTSAFPTLKEEAKTHAAALIARSDFPAYEGKDLADIASRKTKAAAEAAAAAEHAAAEKAKEEAGVKTVHVSVTTAKARTKIASFKSWLEAQAPGGTATVTAPKPSELAAEVEFVDYAKATAGLALIDGKEWNTKRVTAEIPDPS